MIASRTLTPDASPADASNATHRALPLLAPAAVILFGIVTFLPYPALPIGNQSAVQMGNVLSLLMLAGALMMPWRNRPVYLNLLILAPLVLSAINVGLTQSGDLDICVKNIGIWVMLCATVMATQLFAPRYALHLLTGIAVITLVHVAVGIWQMYCFSLNEFPFAGFYVNQSFLSVQDYADTIARYVRRPFGLFPEPSAMSSSLAPWVLFWIAELAGVVRLREQPARWQRILFGFAAAGGLGLIILSSSGHTVITLAGLFVIVVLWFRKLRATPRTFAVVLPILLVLAPIIVWSTWAFMSARVDSEYQANGSWDDRTSSMVAGIALYAKGDLPKILFGIGTGLSSTMIWNAARYEAIFSLLLGYLCETGVVGAVAVFWIGAYLVRVWRATGLNIAFAAILFVWLLGVAITTDYAQLLPIWVTLGWLSVWPAICSPSRDEPRKSPRSSRRKRASAGDQTAGGSAGRFRELKRNMADE